VWGCGPVVVTVTVSFLPGRAPPPGAAPPPHHSVQLEHIIVFNSKTAYIRSICNPYPCASRERPFAAHLRLSRQCCNAVIPCPIWEQIRTRNVQYPDFAADQSHALMVESQPSFFHHTSSPFHICKTGAVMWH
jgi:hypothetical protein